MVLPREVSSCVEPQQVTIASAEFPRQPREIAGTRLGHGDESEAPLKSPIQRAASKVQTRRARPYFGLNYLSTRAY